MNETDSIKADGGADSDASALGTRLAGKYMTFRLANEIYGVEILTVRDINRIMAITRVPGTKPFVRGVINLRGKVIPVLDLCQKFNMGSLAIDAWTVIIVVEFVAHSRKLTMGILVDEVLDVVGFTANEISPPPDFGGGGFDTEYLLGVGRREERVVFLLDTGRVLTTREDIGLVADLAQGSLPQGGPASPRPAETEDTGE